ncbi:DcaP family trimeric outer membrane transporter [Sediminicoccus sp. KRV36]|uniref:DcaP family trimeric outer membrane transporter n=1 Tax=Sediminicoccus sp. KRV36 TaxID=3133721 RepID=UPI00200F24A9|nr:DcaP family trimeric outer membrane transporter [Sediminicoccus rosea]UPY35745.1 porin [Sediminicoccus rosea]
MRPRPEQPERRPALWALAAALAMAGAAPAAQAQGNDAATVLELRRQMEEMRRRMEQLEALVARQPRPAAPPRATAQRAAPQPPTPQADVQAAQAAAREARSAADEAQAIQRNLARATLPAAGTSAPLERDVPGLQPPEPMGDQTATGDALRADLPGIAFRVPGTETQVRLYGWAKLSAWTDANGRNQTDAPLPGGIPLTASAADRQGGDFGMTARFSRFGVDTRTLTAWGTLETRLEGDFGGGSATSGNAVFRLRQAWGELGDERLRVLVGQANSLWNEGLYETLIDATNLNQSFIRQAQLRVTARLATGLTGQVSIEAPDTAYTSSAGVFTPDSRLDGGASPAFNAMPDFHARLTYRKDGLELGARGMIRQLQIRPAGTAAEFPLSGSRTATGIGAAGHVRFPMRWLSEWFGADELLAMAYVGEGIGRYLPGSTNGLDALSNIGMAGVQGRVSLDPVPAWGVTAGYRRFWTPQFRSNLSYSYARQDFADYAQGFTPGSASATGLNREVQQVFANIIWSPFGQVRNGVFGSGWLDVGLEYLYTRRDISGGAAAAGPGQVGHGIANRFLFATIARF